MTISTNQQVDYLWKKIGFGAAKTDVSTVLDATNEPFASPLQIRADKILTNSGLIPNVIPGSNSSVVTVYPTSAPVQCIADTGASTNRSWETGLTYWVPPEFGSTYQVKVYIAPTGQPANVTTKGTQVFATGSGNSDEWFFDYQAGILNFIGTNLPSVSFTGNSVYVSGAVYSGVLGLPNIPSVGNITFNGDTISTSDPAGNIFLSATGSGYVQITGNLAVGIPSGSSATRPANPAMGATRFNTDEQDIEIWNGYQWITPGEAVITSDLIIPDGTSNVYTLSSNATTNGVLVSINGTLQQPVVSYTVANSSITFTEVPVSTDVIEVRHITVGAITITSLQYGLNNSVSLDGANVNIKGNLVPTANLTYDLGSASESWGNIYVHNVNSQVVNNSSNILATTANVASTIDSYATSAYRTSKYLVQASYNSNFECYEMLVIQDGTNVATRVYNVVNTNIALGNVSAAINSGNVLIQYTGLYSNIVVRHSKNYLMI